MANDWDYSELLNLGLGVEAAISALATPGQLVGVYKAASLGADPHTRRAWADVAPAAALRRFGDCRPVNELLSLAAADLAELLKVDIC